MSPELELVLIDLQIFKGKARFWCRVVVVVQSGWPMIERKRAVVVGDQCAVGMVLRWSCAVDETRREARCHGSGNPVGQ